MSAVAHAQDLGELRRRPAGAAAGRLLRAVLFLTILISSFVLYEPAPYEVAAALLGLACIVAGVTLDRRLLPLVVLLIVWNVGGLIALVPVVSEEKTVTYTAVSWFMAYTAVVFACIFARDTLRRLLVMRRAYVVTAVVASVIGAIGYFNLLPGAGALFATIGRANSTFKDPNVFGPFLILPLLFLIQSVLAEGFRPLRTAALLTILMGLLLSFSRGAWLVFALSGAVMMGLMFLTAPSRRARTRIVTSSVLVLIALASLVMVALSFDAIGEMFEERAKLVQSYDAGTTTGRFDLQKLALQEVFDRPLGMGPHEFARVHGLQQHNVYLHAFLVYGWIGGFAYLTLVLLTISVGLRAAFVATPWRPYAIATLAAFIATALEGLVIDTDHWRHFFLLLGLVWGLFVATERERKPARAVRGPVLRAPPRPTI